MGRRVLSLVLALVLGSGLLTVPAAASQGVWLGTWSAAMQRPTTGFAPNWSEKGFADHTVRQVVRTSVGGALARVRLSNHFGAKPLRVAGATIARTAEGAAVRPGSVRPLTFRLSKMVEIPPGGQLLSDPVPLSVAPLERLTVTLYLAEPTGPATTHLFATTTSYRASGDHVGDVGAAAFTEKATSWFYLAGVEVTGPPLRRDAVVAFGDSITEGAMSTVDGFNTYPDELAERLGNARAVLNTGIGGNRVLNDSACLGERAGKRFQRDVLDQPRVRTVIVMEGINDIGMSEIPGEACVTPNPKVTAAELIAGHHDLVKRAHAKGIRVIGATITPFKGAGYFTERGEAVRDEVNTWIRTSGVYDAVLDLDRVMADPADPDALRPAYDSGDRLHPSDAGYRAMAAAVDLSTL
ncbi:SGNH/GDSL hydrolase family protein [Allokutzneria sp. A3M-2-11 16]|uniref:SGNH/GDSL hydrolase family protein n=1 Tax=Allokutzneria sp. A3M-2-11 16 TaxID=2962043 RepID=UPI0020B7D563|nr:SGNH/GDSL hydrolase family protein [Allokutzneria sp. A3M-2-11 16]MCP3803916.1 SGNH/GDSL hydrolase family protein [Allokutzneria sp. A3M-2-11 16]